MTYEAELRTPYTDGPSAVSLMRGRICAVVLDGKNIQVGQARDFRLSRDNKLICTIDCNEAWEQFKTASQEGATLFVREFPVAGPFSSPVTEVVNG